ncbi:ankyrin repeat domain-containing protein [Erwinia pyrifoliae]|uniref:ankyrin repeat domain-containing protein n=1 Tax=Erwinia pyrifoliae TaxID=79967 RepID=UPI000196149A|nr:ankyrin repeat domain-containing protein [Erwinia pyrifoliae]UXK12221.1 ankyrin repeat domain-containing protein [Erwinia pyrifoliae]CAX57334.1 putative lipoprotein [Erwinia pyrifoliae Ep1/96]CAY76202.1 Inversin [Erwinia pyrifoliae DSM 12163]
MKRILIVITILLSALMVQGCKKGMDLKAQDYFEGKQLALAKEIEKGERGEIRKILPDMSAEELNRPGKASMTLLFWAISSSLYDQATPERLQIITELVKAGADPLQPQPNMPGSPAESMMQADKGIWIKAILDGGLSPNARDRVHHEPIIFESFNAKNTETLKVLIDYRADLNIQDSLKRTPLINALYSGKIEHIQLLLLNGADPLINDRFNDNFVSLVNKEISEGDKENKYIKSLIEIRKSIGGN